MQQVQIQMEKTNDWISRKLNAVLSTIKQQKLDIQKRILKRRYEFFKNWNLCASPTDNCTILTQK